MLDAYLRTLGPSPLLLLGLVLSAPTNFMSWSLDSNFWLLEDMKQDRWSLPRLNLILLSCLSAARGSHYFSTTTFLLALSIECPNCKIYFNKSQNIYNSRCRLTHPQPIYRFSTPIKLISIAPNSISNRVEYCKQKADAKFWVFPQQPLRYLHIELPSTPYDFLALRTLSSYASSEYL